MVNFACEWYVTRYGQLCVRLPLLQRQRIEQYANGAYKSQNCMQQSILCQRWSCEQNDAAVSTFLPCVSSYRVVIARVWIDWLPAHDFRGQTLQKTDMACAQKVCARWFQKETARLQSTQTAGLNGNRVACNCRLKPGKRKGKTCSKSWCWPAASLALRNRPAASLERQRQANSQPTAGGWELELATAVEGFQGGQTQGHNLL